MAVKSTDLENGIRLIQFSGESATQSFSREFLPHIAQAIDAGLTHPNVRALVLTGEGKFFSAGADINAFAMADGTVRVHSALMDKILSHITLVKFLYSAQSVTSYGSEIVASLVRNVLISCRFIVCICSKSFFDSPLLKK